MSRLVLCSSLAQKRPAQRAHDIVKRETIADALLNGESFRFWTVKGFDYD